MELNFDWNYEQVPNKFNSKMENNHWIDHFIGNRSSSSECSIESCVENLENQYLSYFKEITWTNYFEQDEEVIQDFEDQLGSPSFIWKDYFMNRDDEISKKSILFEKVTAFTDKQDWICWDDLFHPFQWINFHSNVELNCSESEMNFVACGGGRESILEIMFQAMDNENEDEKLGSSSTSPVNNDLNNTNPRPFSSRSSNLQSQHKTCLTPKTTEWFTPKFTAIVSLLNTRHSTIPQVKIENDYQETGIKTPEQKRLSPRRSPLVVTLTEDETDISQDLSNDLSQASSSNEAECHNDIENDPQSGSHDLTLASLPEIYEPKDDDDDYEDILNFPALTPDPLPSNRRISPAKSPGGSEEYYKKRSRPYTSQGPFFHDSLGDSSLLQVPSNHKTLRRTSEPELPKLVPPKIVKTPPNETKYWAVRKNEPWASFEKPERSKSPLKKLKKIPEHRSRSAMEKPTVFDVSMPTAYTRVRNNTLPPLETTETSLNKSLSPFSFRFSRASGKVTPKSRGNKTSQTFQEHKGILSKINPKKPKHKTRHGTKSFLKKKNWAPVIRNILNGSFRKGKTTKVKSVLEVCDAKSSYMLQENNNFPSSDYVKVVDYRNHNVLPEGGSTSYASGIGRFNRPNGADPRRRSPWIRFLRYWDIRRHFERRSRRKKRCEHKIEKIHF